MEIRDLLLFGVAALACTRLTHAQDVPTLFSLQGAAGDLLGRSAAGLGDVDGDGVGDLVVGSPRVGLGQSPSAARARVHSGRTGVLLHEFNGSMLFPDRKGNAAGLAGVDSSFGWSSAGVPDADGDSVPDVLVGAPNHLSFFGQGGRAGLFSGSDGRLLQVWSGAASLGEQEGKLTGKPVGDGFGWDVTGLDDLDGDGRGDVLVGAPFSNFGRGRARVFSGATGAVLLELEPEDLTPGAEFGATLTGLGDLNLDGVPDLAVGAPGWGGGPQGHGAATGRVYLFSGATGASLGVLEGGGAGWFFGRSLASGADVNADGFPDVLVGAPGAGLGRGRVLVYSGRLGAPENGGLELMVGVDSRFESGFGLAVAPAGDLDGDGHDDFLVGVPLDGASADAGSGGCLNSHVHGFSGADGHELMRMDADDSGWQFGAALGFVGDLFGDGSLGFVLGAPGYAGASGQALLAYLPGPSNLNSLPEPQNALQGRPGSPALVKLPLPGGFEDIAFGPLVITPKADGDSVSADLFVPDGVGFVSYAEGTVGNGPQEATVADFNRDGRDDFATVNQGGNSFSVVTAPSAPTVSGAPILGTVITVSTGVNTQPLAIAAGDVDGDDFPDVIVSGSQGLSCFRNDGSGGYVLTDLLILPVVTDIELADMDGDGDLDCVATSGALGGGGLAAVYLSNGDGTFVAGDLFALGPPKASVQLGDMDGDGDVDALVVAHYVQQGIPRARIGAYLNDGQGDLSEGPWPALVVSKPDGLVPTYGAVADINRDGLLDLVYTHADNVSVPAGSFAGVEPPLEFTLLHNLGLAVDGSWQGFVPSSMGTAYAGRAVRPILEDVFTDPGDPLATDPDLIVVWSMDELAGQSPLPQDTTFIGLFIGDGQGGFTDPDPNQYVLGDEPGDGDAGDVGAANDALASGGDGHLDLVFPNLLSNSLSVLLGDGLGGVSQTLNVLDVDELDPESLPPGLWSGGPRVARLGHLDDDGLLDVVVLNTWSDAFLGDVRASLSLFRSLGGGALQKSQYIELPRAGELVLADIDGDGLCDVVVSQSDGPGDADTLLHFRAEGEGRLQLPATLIEVPSRELTGGLVEGPLDAGGQRAVLATSREPLTGRGMLLAFIERDGQLTAPVESVMVSEWARVEGLALSDMGADGLADACAGTAGGRLVLGAGAGDGSFIEKSLNPAAAKVGGGSLAVGRITGDQRPDVVSSKGKGAKQAGVHVLKGTAVGDFTASLLAGLSATGEQGAQRPLLVDFDDDGTTDVVLSHGTANTISVLLSALNSTEMVSAGKPGTGGVTPELKLKGYTTPGSQVQLFVDAALGGATGWLLIGTQAAPGQVPAVALQALLALSPLQFSGAPGEPGAGGGMVLNFRLPSTPAVVGVQLVLQCVVLDDGATDSAPAGLAASNAVKLTVLN